MAWIKTYIDILYKRNKENNIINITITKSVLISRLRERSYRGPWELQQDHPRALVFVGLFFVVVT